MKQFAPNSFSVSTTYAKRSYDAPMRRSRTFSIIYHLKKISDAAMISLYAKTSLNRTIYTTADYEWIGELFSDNSTCCLARFTSSFQRTQTWKTTLMILIWVLGTLLKVSNIKKQEFVGVVTARFGPNYINMRGPEYSVWLFFKRFSLCDKLICTFKNISAGEIPEVFANNALKTLLSAFDAQVISRKLPARISQISPQWL